MSSSRDRLGGRPLRAQPGAGAARPGRGDAARFLRSKPAGGPRWKIWLLPLLVVWAGYTALAGPQGLIRLYQIQGEERQLEQEVATLISDLDSLQAVERRIGKDPFLREKVAREIYGLARDDELIYFLKPKTEMPMGRSGADDGRFRLYDPSADPSLGPPGDPSEDMERFGVPSVGEDPGSGE